MQVGRGIGRSRVLGLNDRAAVPGGRGAEEERSRNAIRQPLAEVDLLGDGVCIWNRATPAPHREPNAEASGQNRNRSGDIARAHEQEQAEAEQRHGAGEERFALDGLARNAREAGRNQGLHAT